MPTISATQEAQIGKTKISLGKNMIPYPEKQQKQKQAGGMAKR
jgi:hypothetical protein